MAVQKVMDMQIIRDIDLDAGQDLHARQDFSTRGMYRFHLHGMIVDTFVDVKGSRESILWCGQSAITQAQRDKLPIFHRMSWIDDFDYPVVIFNDPTLYLYPDLLGGWYQGTLSHFGIDTIGIVCRAIRSAINADARSVYYGSSAGGFWAMLMAARNNAVCMAEIPQTDMFHYPYAGPRETLLNRCYRNFGLDPQDHSHRLKAVNWFTRIRSFPREIHIYQNNGDVEHTQTQLQPFLHDMNKLNYRNLQITMYDTPGSVSGHQVMPKADSLSALNSLLSGHMPVKALHARTNNSDRTGLAATATLSGNRVDISVDSRDKDAAPTFAYYLIENGKRTDMQWYSNKTRTSFRTQITDAQNLKVTVFMKTTNDKIKMKTIQVLS